MNKMTKIKAEIVANSLSPQGDRLTSLLITFPRIILAEYREFHASTTTKGFFMKPVLMADGVEVSISDAHVLKIFR